MKRERGRGSPAEGGQLAVIAAEFREHNRIRPMELQQQVKFGQLETALARLDRSRDLCQRVHPDLVPDTEKETFELTLQMLAEVRSSITPRGGGTGPVTPGTCEAGVAGSAIPAGTRG
ncbi:unnamed protein product, partial [Discosporangium mesarthrocarpum]